MASEFNGGYFKKYAREQRIQTTEENFTKGIKFEQTPLEAGEHRYIVNYDMLNDGRIITPRRGIRTIGVFLPLVTPDLKSKLSQDVLLTHTLDAVEEDNTHYNLYIANECTESTIGLHSGPAEMWVVNKDDEQHYDMLKEYDIPIRDMYAIPISYEIDSIKDGTFSEYQDSFISVEQIDYNAKFENGTLTLDPAWKGGLVFKTKAHPFTLNITVNNASFSLYKAKLVNGRWSTTGDATALTTGSYRLEARTTYYIVPSAATEVIPAKNPYITVSTTTKDAIVDYLEDKIAVGTKTYTYKKGTAKAVTDGLGVTVKVHADKFFEKIKTAGKHIFTYLLNTIEYSSTVQGATLDVDRTVYNIMQPVAGTTAFMYITNVAKTIVCSTTEASIELDIHRYNRKIAEVGEKTFTYNSTEKKWKYGDSFVSLRDYGILFKDPMGKLENSATIKITTESKNMWQLNDNYVNLAEYGITFTVGSTPLKDGDSINIRSVTANTWLYNGDYIKSAEYGIEVIDPNEKLRDGDKITITSSLPTSWRYNNNPVNLAEEGIIFTDSTGQVKDNDTITIVRNAVTGSLISFGNAKHETPGSMYYIPADAVGNGYALDNSRAAKAIGCFAWNNNYYNFNSHGELIRTRYQVATEDIVKTYYTEAMQPRDVKASEAISSGFNMLLEDPYVFKDSFEEGDIKLQGIMLYDDAGKLISEPVLNTPYQMRCFYNVQKDTRYKIKWDYRNINGTVWTTIEEEEYIFKNSDEVPAELKVLAFASPLESLVIRVQAFKWDKEPVISYSSSVANASVIINSETMKEILTEAGKYTFSYDGLVWKYLGKPVALNTYGITFSDVTGGLKAGSTLTITIEYKEQFSDEAESHVSMSLVYSKTPSTSTANKDLKNYDLSKATGMLFWKSRIWLYGLSEDPTVLFASDINEPTYFPYPNNIDIFDEPIMHCAAFNENMLVFTRSALYKLTLNNEGAWTKQIIQGDLNFTEFDTNTIQIVKNMVFFKSGDYYYMVVPKTLSLQNELAIAPVSRNIEKFLDNFPTNVAELFETLYEYNGSLELAAHYNFLNYEDVHNVYTFVTDSGLLLNLVLLYNTVDRYWRFYTYESEEIYRPVRQDATKSSDMYAPMHCALNGKNVLGVQLIGSSEKQIKDFYIPRNCAITTGTADNGKIMAAFENQHIFKNWTLLDCGYRNIITDYKKRCRELQFKFNNVGAHKVTFLTEFILDGETRKGYYKYDLEHIIDPNDPNFGLIYIARTPIENLDVVGSTFLGKDSNDTNMWTLDYSRFPEIAFIKARFKVSGKGYTPRFKLMSRSEENYEMIGYSWVFRALYSR